jgi:hypothetical protein
MPIEIVEHLSNDQKIQQLPLPDAVVNIGNGNMAYLSKVEDLESLFHLKIYRKKEKKKRNDGISTNTQKGSSNEVLHEIGENFLQLSEEQLNQANQIIKPDTEQIDSIIEQNKNYNQLIGRIRSMRTQSVRHEEDTKVIL